MSNLIKVAAASRNQKQDELLALARSGVKLPMSIDAIIAIEQRGGIVDLETGEVIEGGATHTFTATEEGRKSVFRR